mmetsp:Transcript_52781/g.98848  ORF Transcript_52781/g.98848 Transcript_52781/m.98848 type:complete len:363 (-) Transcript_52781:53-1141(-)
MVDARPITCCRTGDMQAFHGAVSTTRRTRGVAEAASCWRCRGLAAVPWKGTLGGIALMRRISSRTRLQGRGFGGEPVAASQNQISTKEAFATSESAVGKFNQEVMASIDAWCDDLVAGLRDHGWWASPDSAAVLPAPLLRAMRQEVEDLWENGDFIQSQSVLGGTMYYDKKHVFATEIKSERYLTAPRMWHYTVTMTRELVRRVNAAFPEMGLSDKFIGNKLNMSVGEGAVFDAHLDVGVAERPFNRKLSLLLYLNEEWRPALGGEIVLLGEGQNEADAANSCPEALGLPVTLPPTSGRLVAFWSDKILHKVKASQVVKGMKDYRVSYVIWLLGDGDDDGAAGGTCGDKDSSPAESAPSWAY